MPKTKESKRALKTKKLKKKKDLRMKSIMGAFKRILRNDPEHIKVVKTSQDPKCDSWYFIIGKHPFTDCKTTGEFSGNYDEFLEGQFLGHIKANPKHPFEPPEVKLLTPTEVFPINDSKFCIDVGGYHKENFPAALCQFDGFIHMIWSSLEGWDELGYGIKLKVSYKNEEQKQQIIRNIKRASEESVAYNKKHYNHILEMFRRAEHYQNLS